jgi:hypothetical protein
VVCLYFVIDCTGDYISMITDEAFADSISVRLWKVVTPGIVRVERRSFFQLNFTHNERFGL